MTLVIKADRATGNPALPVQRLDAFCQGDNGGVKFLFDLASFPDSPATGNVIKDRAEVGDGSVTLTGTGAVVKAGGGFDFSAVDDRSNCVAAPAGALASINTNENFLVFFYWKLPAEADWYSNTGFIPLFDTTAHNSGYSAPVADMVAIGTTSAKELSVRRQTAGATVTTRAIPLVSGDYGIMNLWAYWRNASGDGVMLQNANRRVISPGTRSGDNSGDFSANVAKFGVPQALWGTFAAKPSLASFNNFRLYRGGFEDLSISGRAPVDILDADYARTVARGVFT